MALIGRVRTEPGVVASFGVVLVALAAVTVSLVDGSREEAALRTVPRLVPANLRFFSDPQSNAAEWVRQNATDRRAGVVRRRIVSQPQGVWFTTGNPGTVQEEVRQVATRAAERSELPVLVMYAIPHRDCARRSGGGAPNLDAYGRWVAGFSRGLGSLPAWVVLEPDSLAQADCLTPRQRTARFLALRHAARTLRQHNPAARIYFDAGNSSWQPVTTIVDRLRESGADRHGHGIALNVANFNPTEDEVRYGVYVIRSLGDRELRLVVDTGRNGNGRHAGLGTCDPAGRGLGTPPTSDTDSPWVDAYLWVKPPGQSDGCRGSAGIFLPDDAYRLAVRARGTRSTSRPRGPRRRSVPGRS